MLELGHLELAREARQSELVERVVDHAAHDHGADGVVGARLGAEPEPADVARIDVVLPDQPQHGVGRHRVDVLVLTHDAKAAADDDLTLSQGVSVHSHQDSSETRRRGTYMLKPLSPGNTPVAGAGWAPEPGAEAASPGIPSS